MKEHDDTPTARIYNEDDKDVTDRAKDYSKRRRTYPYSAYDGDGNLVGYCVPK